MGAQFASADYIRRIDESTSFLQEVVRGVDVVIVCGSGLGESIKTLLSDQSSIPYTEIPHFPISTIPGHASNLIIGHIKGRKCAVMQGRAHYYEGHDMRDLVIPVRVFAKLGISKLILTNACGSVNLSIHTGDIVLITDHVSMPCMSGITPLRGANYDKGPRFPGLTHLWRQSIDSLPPTIKTGTYGFISGPQFETPAEVRALRLLGIDIVGMSTVPEAIAAKQAGINTIVGLSLVTNECIDSRTLAPHEPTHKEVLLNSAMAGNQFAKVIEHIIINI